MKKFFSGILVGLLLAILFLNVSADVQLKLIVNGKDITTTAEPIIHNNKTYTPARAVAEALGATVEWNGTTKTVFINKTIDENNVGYSGLQYILSNEIWKLDKENKVIAEIKYVTNEKVVFMDEHEGALFEVQVVMNGTVPQIPRAEFLEKYNAYLVSIDNDSTEEGYITFKEIREKYNLGWWAVSSFMGQPEESLPSIDPDLVVGIARMTEAIQKGGEVIFIAGPAPGHIAFSIPWQDEWDATNFYEMQVKKSEFLEVYNAYLASREG